MGREKTGFRDTMAALNEMFPDQITLGKAEIAAAYGVHVTTVSRWIRDGKLNMSTATGRIGKPDLARQICIGKE